MSDAKTCHLTKNPQWASQQGTPSLIFEGVRMSDSVLPRALRDGERKGRKEGREKRREGGREEEMIEQGEKSGKKEGKQNNGLARVHFCVLNC